jgi:excisionase family DNA binding protein
MLAAMTPPPGPEEGALPVAEAARRLGVSSLRIRQYVAEGRLDAIRDNRGRLRVELRPEGPRPPRASTAAPAELLIEELLEIREDGAERDQQLQRLERLVGELSGMLGRALDALEAEKDRAGEDRRRAERLRDQAAAALDLAERAMAAARRGPD